MGESAFHRTPSATGENPFQAVITQMVQLAANLSMMFNEVDFLDRFAAAASAGFKGVEYLFSL